MTLLEALIKLQTKGPSDHFAGICKNVSGVLRDFHCYYGTQYEKLLHETFKKWPKFSGSISYPVPAVTCSDPEVEYNNEDDMWVGTYGDLRKELLQFCIDELSKE